MSPVGNLRRVTERRLRQPLERMVEGLAQATSVPPPRNFTTSSGVVRQALQEAVGLEVTDEQLEEALTGGRTPSGEWFVERHGDDVRFRRSNE